MAHVLIIDDDPISRKVLRSILASAGHTVSEAVDGLEGVRLFEEQPADLVITDIYMPNQEGIETACRLMQEFDAKVIAVSGGGEKGNLTPLEWARTLGVEHVFSKPFDREAILAAVADLLG